MTKMRNKSLRQADTIAMEKAIPIASRRFGSWGVLISGRPLSPADLASRHDAVSGSWERTTRRFQLKAAYREPLVTSQIATSLTRVGPKARILDCGVGNGSLSIALDSILENQVDYHGIDTSADMIVQARSKMQHAGLRPNIEQADVLSLPYDDQSFDLVMAAHVLEHLPDPQSALKEMIRVLRPGVMVFLCLTRPSIFGAFVQLRWRKWAITELQGIAWLRDCLLSDVGSQPVYLGSCTGVASTPFLGATAPVTSTQSKEFP